MRQSRGNHSVAGNRTKEELIRANVSERAQKHRRGLRAFGIPIWVTDTRRPGFAEECSRQSRVLRYDPHEAETLEWLETAADTEGSE